MKSKKLSLLLVIANIFISCRLEAYASDSNLISINFGDKLTYQEENGYESFTGSNALENFYQAKEELPDEVPVISPFEVRGENVFYVSPDGNDLSDGGINAPFKTAKRALDAVSGLTDSQKSHGSIIYFRGGSYDVKNTEYRKSEHS